MISCAMARVLRSRREGNAGDAAAQKLGHDFMTQIRMRLVMSMGMTRREAVVFCQCPPA